MNANRFINPLSEGVADFQILWSEPAADTVGLEIGMKATSKILVSC
jgi:hypothetical protein